MKKKDLKILFLCILIFCLLSCVDFEIQEDPDTDLPTQGWTLFNDANDMAYVIVKPFTYSGTFTETDNSPGWWLYDPGGNRVARIPLNGTVSHSSNYDRWYFTITVQGGGIQLTGTGEGQTSNGIYPYARDVYGTTSGTATSPLGSQVVSGTWYGNCYTIWN